MTKGALICRELTRRFGGVTALSGVSLEFPTGAVMGVIGPNGSGKSTLFNLLSGELAPSEGEVEWQGRRIDGQPTHVVANLGIVRTYQSATVFPQLSVRECMEFAAWVARGRPVRPIAEIAELTGLSSVMDERCGALPYGYQKILGVALGLLTSPAVLLLDEPAAGLNQAEVRRFLKLIADIRLGHNIGIGIIDHDMTLIMPACDRIAVLNFGNLIALGTPSEIRRNTDVVEIYLSGDLRRDAAD